MRTSWRQLPAFQNRPTAPKARPMAKAGAQGREGIVASGLKTGVTVNANGRKIAHRTWANPAVLTEQTNAAQTANGWTPERRARQAEAIQQWKPWEKSTGPRTTRGKAR